VRGRGKEGPGRAQPPWGEKRTPDHTQEETNGDPKAAPGRTTGDRATHLKHNARLVYVGIKRGKEAVITRPPEQGFGLTKKAG
jgi:hypothetical protein